ncbi:MAG: acetyl-CoA carboxylase carboxyl transferase subunit alpha [Pseudonocardiaceae bacterium]
MVFGKRWLRDLRVCPDCGLHSPLPASERLDQLLDTGWAALNISASTVDVLGFVDTRPYPERLSAARRKTGLSEAVLCARGAIEGRPVIAAVMDFRFLGGSLGGAVGELITQAGETALRECTPLLLVTASGGARMQEGPISLMQMAKTSQMLAQLDEGGVLSISLITDPTFGGVAASFATLCDVIIAEPRARLGFAGPRVIAQTIKQTLPPGFQTAEFLFARGLIDGICPRSELRGTLARLLDTNDRCAPGSDSPRAATAAPLTDPDLLPERSAWEVVKRARDLDRPTTLDYLNRLLDDFVELHGDRLSGDCPAIVGGTGKLDGRAVVVVGHQKGHTIGELSARNFGMPIPAGYRKAARLFRLAAKLRLPVISFIDTPGAYPGIAAEEHGQSIAIAENLRLMSELPVPVVAVITGEGGSGGALALAVANRVLICADAVYSVISPEGCAAILWDDPGAAPVAAAALRMDARELLRLGVVDGVVPEPHGGAGHDHAAAADRMRAALRPVLDDLSTLSPSHLITQRQARFRAFGVNTATGTPDGQGAR